MGYMQPYGPEHWAALLVIAVATPVLVRAARRGSDHWITVAGWILLAVSVAWALWDMRPSVFDLRRSLPLHLSDLARLTASLALITRRARWIAPTYYWGLTLNVQSIVTPDLGYAVDPALEYVMYWFLHAAVLIAPIILVVVHRPAHPRLGGRGHAGERRHRLQLWLPQRHPARALASRRHGPLAPLPVRRRWPPRRWLGRCPDLAVGCSAKAQVRVGKECAAAHCGGGRP